MPARFYSIAMLLLIALAVTAIGLILQSDSADGGKSPCRVTILFTGDDWGNLKPCG